MTAATPSFVFRVGERDYFVTRSDRRNGYDIVSNGDLVMHVSASHWGEIGAFRRVAEAMERIEAEWAALQT